MISQRLTTVDTEDPNAEVDAATWVVEQFTVEGDQASVQSRIHRTLTESQVAWPGQPADMWRRWILESCQSLGMQCRSINCAHKQIYDLVREGGRLIIRLPETGDWIGVSATGGRKVAVLNHNSEPSRLLISRRQLKSLLQSPQPNASIECVLLQPQLSGKLVEESAGRFSTPISRARKLLLPEAADVRIVIIFAVVSGALAMTTPLAIEALVSTVTFGRLLQPILVLSLLLLAFLMFQAAIRGLQTWVAEIIQRRLFARVATDLAFRLPRVQAEAVDGQPARELVNRFFDVVTVQKFTAGLLLDGISVVVNTLVGMAVLGFYHPWLLGFDVVLLAMITFVIFVLGRGAIATSIKESKLKYQVAAWLEDLSGCPISFRYYGAPQFALGRTDHLIHGYLTARRHHFHILLRQILFSLGLQAIASTALLGLGGWLVISGELTLGQLVAAELIVTVIVGSFAKLGKHMESFYDMLAAVDKLGQLFDLPMERQDGMLSPQTPSPSTVSFRQVVHRGSAGSRLFDHLDLQIAAGERVALCGPSGSGKSMLLDFLYALRKPEQGYLEIDGIDPRELRPDMLRRSVVLLRDIEVFEGTVLQNVHLERPDVNAEEARVALDQVGLLDQILELPEGLDTRINTSGFPLSSNQQRKLMLARAIAGSPNLLMIDGLLDSIPEQECQSLLELLTDSSQPWTLITVTGRESIASVLSRRIQLGEIAGISRRTELSGRGVN